MDIIEKQNIKLIYVDLFCGAGGTSTGVLKAKVGKHQCAVVAACINHDNNAIRSHKSNHKQTLHFTEDITMLYKGGRFKHLVNHLEYVKAIYPLAKVVLWASLECTNFSKAKGGQPRDADSRTLADHLFPYIEALNPDYIQIENVEEFMSWGELDYNGKPISKLAGSDYVRWTNSVKKYGYNFEHRILNAANYGARTTRKRFFGQFAKVGLPTVWPEPTHEEKPDKGLFGSGLKPWKPVKDVLDFNDEGESIFSRKKPLVDATHIRVYAGLLKFVAGGKESFLVKYNSMSRSKKYVAPSVDSPCPVVSCQNRLGVIQAKFLSKYFSGSPDSKNISLNGPAGTITTKDHHSVISPIFLSSYYGNGDNVSSVDKPSPTVTTKDRISLVQTKFIDQQYGQSKPSSINKPVGAITTNPKYNVVSCQPWIMNTNFRNVGSSIDQPAQTITANRKWHYLMNPQFASKGGSIDKPCFTLIARMDKMPPYLMEASTQTNNLPSFIRMEGNTLVYEIYSTDSEIMVKIKEFMALYGLVDIKMRMLRIKELKLIMGFPEDYILIGTQADQKKFIGNAVEVTMARVMCESLANKLIELSCHKFDAA